MDYYKDWQGQKGTAASRLTCWTTERQAFQYPSAGVLAFFCEFEFSMIKYLFYLAGTAIFWLSCLSYNIAWIFLHVKGGLVRDRENLPLDIIKNCAKEAFRHT